MSRILHRSVNDASVKSEIIIPNNFKEGIHTTDGESEHISLETTSEFTSKSD